MAEAAVWLLVEGWTRRAHSIHARMDLAEFHWRLACPYYCCFEFLRFSTRVVMVRNFLLPGHPDPEADSGGVIVYWLPKKCLSLVMFSA